MMQDLGLAIDAASAQTLMDHAEFHLETSRSSDGSPFELEINRRSLGNIVGKAATEKLFGKYWGLGILTEYKALPSDLKKAVIGRPARRGGPTQRVHPALSLRVMSAGDKVHSHPDLCEVTVNVPLGGTYTGGEFSLLEHGKFQRKELKPRHAYAHPGSTRHKVSKVKSGRRFSLIAHYSLGNTTTAGADVGVSVHHGKFVASVPSGPSGVNKYIGLYATREEAQLSAAFAREHGLHAAKAKFPCSTAAGGPGFSPWTTADDKKLRKYKERYKGKGPRGRIDWSKWNHPRFSREAARKHGRGTN